MRPLLQALSKDLGSQIEQAELRGLARSVSEVEWLLLVLSAAYLITPGGEMVRPGLAVIAAILFAALSLALHFLPAFRAETRLKIAVQLLSMVAFITVFVYSIDRHPGSLLILYLLPVIVCALTLGRRPTFVLTLSSAVAFTLAAVWRDPSAGLAGREIAEIGIALAPFMLVAYVTAQLAHEIQLAKQRIRTLSETDELTGLMNMRAFARVHRLEHERARRHARSYAVVLMDLNGLKQINDSYGHDTGNRAIVLFANVIMRLIRTTDAAARYGGDEFLLLLSETDVEQASLVSQRIRAAVSRCAIDAGGQSLRLTVSVGTAVFPDDADDPRRLIEIADGVMYRDKHATRNPVATAASRAAQARVV